MKNNIVYVLLFCAFILASKQVNAQNNNHHNKHNYLTLAKKIGQLEPVLLAAKELAKEDKEMYGVFHVVLCGKTVKDLETSKIIKPLLQRAKEQQVKVFACGFSLQKFGISPQKLPKGMEVVKNGVLYGFQLKKKGFITLSL